MMKWDLSLMAQVHMGQQFDLIVTSSNKNASTIQPRIVLRDLGTQKKYVIDLLKNIANLGIDNDQGLN